MQQPAVIVDVDNTLVDTAQRKALLLEKLGLASGRDLDAIRGDYWLEGFLGDRKSPRSEEFFRNLETPEAIEGCPANLLPGARETIAWLIGRGYMVHYVSGRPSQLFATTLSELRRLGLTVDQSSLHLSSRLPGATPAQVDIASNDKVRAIRELAREWDVLAVIGDQPEDIAAGSEAGAPTVLLTSTISATGISQSGLQAMPTAICASWPEIAVALARFESGGPQLIEQRQQLADQYASWLNDLDGKAQTTVLISGALSALTTPVLTGEHFSLARDWLLVLSLLLAILSMVYAIRSLTSIYTSGRLTARAIPVKLKQWIAIFLDWPACWKSNPEDALGEYEALKRASPSTRARAHLQFFRERFGTTDPDIIVNMRLYAMRASNYSKAYAERLASKLLIVAIVLSGVWVVFKAAGSTISKGFRWL